MPLLSQNHLFSARGYPSAAPSAPLPQTFASFDPFAASPHHLHPCFVQLALLMSNREITGASRRADALLDAFQRFIDDFPTALPPDSASLKPSSPLDPSDTYIASAGYLTEAEARSYPMLLSRSLSQQYASICAVRAPSVPMKRVYEEIHEMINAIDRNCEPDPAKKQIQKKVSELRNVGMGRRVDGRGCGGIRRAS